MIIRESTDEKKKVRGRISRIFVLAGLTVFAVAVLGYTLHQGTSEVIQNKYPDGKIKEIWLYKGKVLGKKKKIKEIHYFNNGTIESEIDYRNGRVNGWAKLYYPGGKLHVEAPYRNGHVHGVRMSYHESGKKFCMAEYDNGKLLNKKNWDESGNEIYLDLDRP